MDYAFDVILKEEEDAKEVAKTARYLFGKRFRYQCLCCGEEVYLAAADSIKRTPHFKHQVGNNDTECELYLGKLGILAKCAAIRKNKKEHIGFFFNIDNKTFEIAFSFSVEEINNKESLLIFNKFFSQEFFSIPINKGNLVASVRNYFALIEYSNDYYVSIDSGRTKTLYPDVIKKNGQLNIYRVNQQNNHYKLHNSDTLYTDYWYLAVSEEKENIEELMKLQGLTAEETASSFTTLGKLFYSIKFLVNYITEAASRFFYSQDLKVDNSETLSILWPPVIKKETEYASESEKVILSSSFELIPHGNIEGENLYIQKICNDVYSVSFKSKVIICEKNVECQIVKEDRAAPAIVNEPPAVVYADKYIIPSDYDYYMFDKNGSTKLLAGARIYLSRLDYIVGYKNNHIKILIKANKQGILDKKQLIETIIKYHPQSEQFDPDEFMNIEADETVLSYIESCYRSGRINTVVKQYIKEKSI